MWLLVPPVLLVRFAVASRGWPLAAAVWLVLATPLVAAFTYAVGPYDARPWWEAISAVLTVIAGLCLLGAAAFSSRSRSAEGDVTDTSPTPASEPASPRVVPQIVPAMGCAAFRPLAHDESRQ